MINARLRRRKVRAMELSALHELRAGRDARTRMASAEGEEPAGERAVLRKQAVDHSLAAVEQAEKAAERCRPLGDRYPAAVARTLATLAKILCETGLEEDAKPVICEALTWCARADARAENEDLLRAIGLLSEAGRTTEMLELVEQVLERVRPAGGTDLARTLTEHGRHLLRNERAEEGLLALRESLRLQPRLARYRLDTVVLIFHGLGATGRYDELREHSDFWLSIVQRFSRRHRYPSLLRSLHGYWTEAGDEERVREIQELLSRPAR